MVDGDDAPAGAPSGEPREPQPLRTRLAGVWPALAVAFVLGVGLTLVATAAFRASDEEPGTPPATSGAPAGTGVAPAPSTSATPTVPTVPTGADQTTTPTTAAEVSGDPVVQWGTYEVTLAASADHRWFDYPVQVVFTHAESATEVTVDGFWDGGRMWRTRFAPFLVGQWSWESRSEDPTLTGASGTLAVSAPTPEALAANANTRGHLRVSADARYLERADGSPFLFLGDTAWWLNSTRCPLQPGPETAGIGCADYLDDRVAKGFTVIGIEMFDIHNANEGGFPFPCNADDNRGNGDYSCLNPEHFQQLDLKMGQLYERGLVAYAHVSWLVGQLPNEETTPTQAKALGRYVMARYGWMPMLFSISGEYQYGYDDLGVRWTKDDWDSYGAFLQQHNPQNHPLTVHPSSSARWNANNPGAGEQSSAGQFHTSDWLDVNSVQSGHAIERLRINPLRVSQNAALEPRKPVLHSEGYYLENSPEVAPVTDAQLRWQAYVPFLNGALGHIYGANGIWQMYTGGPLEEYPSLLHPGATRPWWEVMAHPSSTQVARAATFYRDVVGDWWALQPRRGWIGLPGRDYQDGATDPHLAATPDGSVIVVFFGELHPSSAPTVARDGSLQGLAFAATWFDPRTGERLDGGRVVADAEGALVLPARPSAGDWALVLSAR